VEFAGIFNGMGSQVHLVYRQPLPLRSVGGGVKGSCTFKSGSPRVQGDSEG